MEFRLGGGVVAPSASINPDMNGSSTTDLWFCLCSCAGTGGGLSLCPGTSGYSGVLLTFHVLLHLGSCRHDRFLTQGGSRVFGDGWWLLQRR